VAGPAPTCAAGADAACLDVELAIAYVDDALVNSERNEVERRIDRCAGCREIVAAAARRSQVDGVATRVDRPIPGGAARQAKAVIGRYIVERELGSGGMGVVFLARDPDLHRPVVIKLVRPDAFDEVGDDLELRLRREAQAMAQLSHANVVQIFDLGRDGERVFIAMELVAGMTLSRWLASDKRTHDAIIAVFVQAARGLAAAHRAGLVHRDFKPSNVMVGDDGIVKVADFGLARSPAMPASSASPPRSSGVHAAITGHGLVVGTPAYMAPEQRVGRADARTDQYAFALALADALLGQPPTARHVAPDVPDKQLDAALATVGVIAPTRQAIVRALRPEPAARFASMDEVVAALAPPRRRRAARLIAAAAAAIVAAVAIGVFAWSHGECRVAALDRWTRARAAVVAALGHRAQPFATWRAELVAATIDRAIDGLAIDACRDRESTGCAARRAAALDHAIDVLSEADDPWPVVAAIARCDTDRDAPVLVALHAALATETSRALLTAIAERAERAGELTLAADADERIARSAIATADVEAADAAAHAELALGERAGDDTARVRALVALVELASRRGDHASAARDDDALRAIVARHALAPRDDVAVSASEGAAFVTLGDRVRGEAAWHRALTAAHAVTERDDAVRAEVALAVARYTLHDDGRGAVAAGLAAIRTATGASAEACAEASASVGSVALAIGDAAAATAAFGGAAGDLARRLGAIRARGLTGDVTGALGELDALTARDAAGRVRIAIARAHVLHAANRDDDAMLALRPAQREMILDQLQHRERPWPHLELDEHVDAALLRCDIEVALRTPMPCFDAEHLVSGLAPLALARARAALGHARSEQMLGRAYGEQSKLEIALPIAIDAQLDPLVIAELHWRLARARAYPIAKSRSDALAARAAFAAAGKDTADIDAWLLAHPDR
jgi:predicted Ser/Thr protein kinase